MSDDLGLSFAATACWFPTEPKPPHVFIRVTPAQVKEWPATFGLALRRCYLSDNVVLAKANEHGLPQASVIAAGLPDAGSTMSGDFGEILTYFYQGARALPSTAIGLKKWRLKQDRTKPAPYSDVVHLVLPDWPAPSANDAVLCSEVKTKALNGSSEPINSSIKDCEKDRTSRLARTLLWLRDRAITGSAEGATIAELNRFIETAGLPAAAKRFQAVAVVCESLVTAELAAAPPVASSDYTLVVIAVPDLKGTYMAVFDAAKTSFPPVVAAAPGGATV